MNWIELNFTCDDFWPYNFKHEKKVKIENRFVFFKSFKVFFLFPHLKIDYIIYWVGLGKLNIHTHIIWERKTVWKKAKKTISMNSFHSNWSDVCVLTFTVWKKIKRDSPVFCIHTFYIFDLDSKRKESGEKKIQSNKKQKQKKA